MKKFFNHFYTISKHKIMVTILLFKCGLYKQGLLHDLSKYSWCEFSAGVRYFQGDRSPIDAEKEALGYSKGWLHHKGRNKHHWEYWLDNSSDGVIGIKVPLRYVLEMVCDRIVACKVYLKDSYTDTSAFEYWDKNKHKILMNEESFKLLETLLLYVKDNGLNSTIKYIKQIKNNIDY